MKIDMLKEIIEKYLEYFPEEKERLNKLNNLVKLNKEKAFNSKNVKGHITASGYIYNKKDKSLLLLEHKKLNKLLQPGGHSEKDDNTTLDTALREIYEETGLKDLKMISIDENLAMPIDIDTHLIPENKKKEMPSHYHHDFGYLFIVEEEEDIKIDINESNGYKWVKIEKIEDNKRFSYVIKKINEILKINKSL